MVDLNQFLNQDLSADDVAHTNGYANTAGGAGAGGLSMERRRTLLNQPRVVGAYQYSRLGRQGPSVKARTADQAKSRVYDASSDSFSDKAGYANNRQQGGLSEAQADVRLVERRQHFVEPPTRGYDKYA